jgi:glycosyltransferase involved in cell wall biosynthesis
MGVPLVISLQGETVMDDMNIYDHSIALRTALRIGLRRANAVTGCSQFVLDDASKRFGLASGTGHVIPNGVERYESTANGSLPLPFRRFIFAVGRVVPKKGFDLLISGFARIAHQHPDVGLVIGGVGSARSDLAELVTQLGLADRVVFPGVLSRNEVAWAMSAAEVFVLPSRIEPFGIVVLEALRAGCPTIVSSHGGAPEIIRDGSDGLVVDPFDTNALSAALHRVLVDRSLTQKLRVAGTARAANFEWASIAARYQHLYKEISA